MRHNIIAYFPSWTGSVEDIPFGLISHVNYSFALPTPNGNLTGVDEAKLGNLARLAHEAGVKVGLAVGGWNDGDCSAFEAMAAGSGNRLTFIRNLLELCSRHRLDGVDIDWEYPKAHSAAGFSLLMAELRAALDTRMFLSTAVISEGDEWGAHIRPEVFGRIDFLNIMAYDWHYQAPGTHHSPLSLAESSLDYWLKRGCPKEKAILGVPFYGRSHAASATYRELVKRDPLAPYKDISGGIQYNGLSTMGRKADIAFRKGGGIMFWEITQDTRDHTSLLAAIHGKTR